MTKATDAEPPAERPVPPRTVNLAIAAVCAQVVFLVIHTASMFGYTDQLSRLLSDSNRKADKPIKDYDATKIAHDLHQIRINGVWQGVIVAGALLLLAFSLRRVTTAGVTRWALIVVMVMTGGPLAVNPVRGLPIVPQVASVLAGLASIIAIVLLFVPQSRKYFKAVSVFRAAATGRAPRARASLFGPRPQVQRKPSPASAARSSAASRTQVAKDPNAGSRSKTRATEAAIAHGAELARSRAKAASKSRRSEL